MLTLKFPNRISRIANVLLFLVIVAASYERIILCRPDATHLEPVLGLLPLGHVHPEPRVAHEPVERRVRPELVQEGGREGGHALQGGQVLKNREIATGEYGANGIQNLMCWKGIDVIRVLE